MEGVIAAVTRYVDEFRTALREDPLKAAGLAALGFLALQFLLKLLRVAWRVRWLLAVLAIVGGASYLVYSKRMRDTEQAMLDSYDNAAPDDTRADDGSEDAG